MSMGARRCSRVLPLAAFTAYLRATHSSDDHNQAKSLSTQRILSGARTLFSNLDPILPRVRVNSEPPPSLYPETPKAHMPGVVAEHTFPNLLRLRLNWRPHSCSADRFHSTLFPNSVNNVEYSGRKHVAAAKAEKSDARTPQIGR